ncbi:hypothetical protein ACUM5Y_08940 [Marinomonas dokdonensis]|uniref:hypothetical protein n=1 Tax=Marinomonas dokdonensis TaxID=328224 RepID=UPI00405559F8
MITKYSILACTAGLVLSLNVAAAPSLNEMQECQAVLDFVVGKTSDMASVYPEQDLQAVREGLVAYNDFIQQDIMTPGLLAYSNNDAEKAATLQQQIDAYKTSVTAGLSTRYSQQTLITDYAVVINGCAKKALPPSSSDVALLKRSLETIIQLAQQ